MSDGLVHPLLSTPSEQTAPALADWLELNLLFERVPELSSTAVRDFLEDDFALTSATWDAFDDDEDLYPDVDEHEDIDAIGLRVEEATMRLERRHRILADAYPITIDMDVLVAPPDWRHHPEFSFLALLAARHRRWLDIDVHERAEAALLFEHLVATAVAHYLDGEAARFGWPLDQEEFTGTFAERVGQLSSLIKERAVTEPTVVSPKQNDMGLDVVGWKHLDARTSKIILLCQCAIGINEDLTEHKVEVERWKKVLSFATTPMTAVATTRDMLETARHEWEAIATVAGVVFDRTRLCLFADVDRRPGLSRRIVDWCERAHPQLSTR